MEWIEINGNEDKPTENIIVRFTDYPSKKGTYYEGYYCEVTEKYCIAGEPPIEQENITHYIILEEPKNIK